MLALAESFRACGHDVTWLGQPAIEASARAVGCRFSPFDGIHDYAARVFLEEQLPIAMAMVAGADIGEQLFSVGTEQRIDLVVVDANLAGCAAAAEALHQPSAVLLHSMYATYTNTWLAGHWSLLAPMINATRERFGLGPCDSWAAVLAGHDRLIASVPERLDAPVTERPPSMRHWGFLVPTIPSVARPGGFGSGDEPRVLVGLSTTFQQQEQLLQAILDALGSLDVRGVASTAGQVDADALRCPPNVQLHEFVDHGRLLADCDVMVTHAGLGSVAAALSHGVPLVCMPLGRDQHLNAERVTSLGAGLALSAESRASDIADAVLTVLADRAFRDAAERLADESARAGGSTAAVEDLEHLVQMS
jgi:UDP:flavonoid glycosyltransferase YjiC (YdhE family)